MANIPRSGDFDEKAAESMREQHSNEQAIEAVTGDGGRPAAGSEGHAAAFEMWTEEELRNRAAELGLDVSGMSRDEMIAAIEHH